MSLIDKLDELNSKLEHNILKLDYTHDTICCNIDEKKYNDIIYYFYKIYNEKITKIAINDKCYKLKFIIEYVENEMDLIILTFLLDLNFVIATFDTLKLFITLPCLKAILIKYTSEISKKIEEEGEGKIELKDYFFYFLFNFNIILNYLENELNKGEINLLYTFFNKIYNKIVIIIDDCKFILIQRSFDNDYYLYRLKSIKIGENIIHTPIYYASNSGMGLLRLASRIEGTTQYEKFLDYNTETQIHYDLQSEIYKKKILLHKYNINFNDILYSKNNINLELHLITKNIIDTNRIILTHERGYHSFYFTIFEYFSCGGFYQPGDDKVNRFFVKINKFHYLIKSIISYIEAGKRDNISEINKPITEDKITSFESIEIVHNEIIITTHKITKIIPILNNNFDKFLCKMKLIDDLLTSTIKSKNLNSQKYNYNFDTNIDKFVIINELLGKILDIIIDEITEEKESIFNYEFEIKSDIRGQYDSYIFINTINRFTALIDDKEWYFYWTKYNVKALINNSICEFNDDCKDYYIITKIIPKGTEKINVSGLDSGFILAGLLQCKPIDYHEQLGYNRLEIGIIEAKNKIDKNFLTRWYYFIGKYNNLLFDNLTKYKLFKEKKITDLIETVKSNKSKYLKYKKKYMS